MAVCSPGNIERRPGDRIKTDKRDAIRLARLFAAGDLRLVWIPSEEQEHLRDLVRCREDLRADLMRARLRLAALVLRRERYFPGPGERWTLKHRHWLSQQRFDDAPSRVTYADYLHAHDVLLARRELVARELEQIAPSASGQRRSRGCAVCAASTWWPTVRQPSTSSRPPRSWRRRPRASRSPTLPPCRWWPSPRGRRSLTTPG